MKDNNLPCDFLDNSDTDCVSLLRDYKQSTTLNHTELMIAKQLLLQRIYDRVKMTVDRALSSSDNVALMLPAGSVVAIVSNYESRLSPDGGES